MPKKIHQDKERLYSELLQVKLRLNEVVEDNIKLKTRITVLEKERDKLTKAIDLNAEPHPSQSKGKPTANTLMLTNPDK
jgi:hypothetical protein